MERGRIKTIATATRIGPTIVTEELQVEGVLKAGQTDNFMVADLGGGYTALSLNGDVDNGARAGSNT